MSRLVYRALLRLTAPDEYRRLYRRNGKKTIDNNGTGKENGRHGSDIRTSAEA